MDNPDCQLYEDLKVVTPEGNGYDGKEYYCGKGAPSFKEGAILESGMLKGLIIV